MRQRRSVGGGCVEVNVHGASHRFLGLTHRMAEIRQNGIFQVLSCIRVALLSLIFMLFLSLSLCPFMPSLPLSFSFSVSCTCTEGFSNTFLLSLTLCLVLSLFSVFLAPSLLPITIAGEKPLLQHSSPASGNCGHIIFDETGRGRRDAANISP